MSFKVGDKVTIKRTSEYYGQGFDNPIDEVGEIVNIIRGVDLGMLVRWSDYSNCYNEEDLELAVVKPGHGSRLKFDFTMT